MLPSSAITRNRFTASSLPTTSDNCTVQGTCWTWNGQGVGVPQRPTHIHRPILLHPRQLALELPVLAVGTGGVRTSAASGGSVRGRRGGLVLHVLRLALQGVHGCAAKYRGDSRFSRGF